MFCRVSSVFYIFCMSFVLTKQPNFLPLFVETAKACRAVAQGVGGGIKPRPRIPLALTRAGALSAMRHHRNGNRNGYPA